MKKYLLLVLLLISNVSYAACYRLKMVNYYFSPSQEITKNISYPILCESNGIIYELQGKFYVRHSSDVYSSVSYDSIRTLHIDRTANQIQFTENQVLFSKRPERIHIGFITLPKAMQ